MICTFLAPRPVFCQLDLPDLSGGIGLLGCGSDADCGGCGECDGLIEVGGIITVLGTCARDSTFVETDCSKCVQQNGILSIIDLDGCGGSGGGDDETGGFGFGAICSTDSQCGNCGSCSGVVRVGDLITVLGSCTNSNYSPESPCKKCVLENGVFNVRNQPGAVCRKKGKKCRRCTKRGICGRRLKKKFCKAN